MSLTKIVVSLPEDVATGVAMAARERGESCSRFIARILRTALRAGRGEEITKRLNALFAQPEVIAEQRRIARELDRAGTNWSDERW